MRWGQEPLALTPSHVQFTAAAISALRDSRHWSALLDLVCLMAQLCSSISASKIVFDAICSIQASSSVVILSKQWPARHAWEVGLVQALWRGLADSKQQTQVWQGYAEGMAMDGLKFGRVVLKFAGATLKLGLENLSFAGSCLSQGPGWS